MKNETYDKLKQVVQVGLPACGSLYFGLSDLWDLPAAVQVVGTIALLTTFLGVWLNIAANRYNNSEKPFDGSLVISDKPDGTQLYSLELTTDPEDMANQDRIVFKKVVTSVE